MTTSEFARAYGVVRTRISQLRGQNLLPPTTEGSSPGQAQWDTGEVFRFLAQQRRDENNPALRLSLLRPRAGVTWSCSRGQIITVDTPRDSWSPASGPVSVHATTYTANALITGCTAAVHLLVVLGPHSPLTLEASVRGPERDGSVLELVLSQLHPDRFWADHHNSGPGQRVAVVVPQTWPSEEGLRQPYPRQGPSAFVLDVFRGEGVDAETLARRPLFDVTDVAATLGHQLPWWPQGHLTADIVTAWEPGTEPVTVTVPPYAAQQYDILRWTERAAAGFGDDADDVRSLGRQLWQTRTSGPRDYMSAAQPDAPEGWIKAVRWKLDAVDHDWLARTNMMSGADAVLDSPATPRHIAQSIVSYCGDPAVFSPVLLRLDGLPEQLQQAITDSVDTEPIPAEASWRLFSLQQVLAEAGATTAVKGARWRMRPAPTENRPPARREPDVLFAYDADGNHWAALHPPREVPSELGTAEDILARGVHLWVIPAEQDRTAYLLTTDEGILIPLPAEPRDARNAAYWLTRVALGQPSHYGPAGPLRLDHPLPDLLGHTAATKIAAPIPWSTVVDLATRFKDLRFGT
ncbi:hypothetical protein [Nocardia sp. NRRL S-836]|uniref:hypothetical protein n=1 Tax=Nocardia sp. NRRL S-836 TaxID=1519492 RepID=UPI0012FBF7E6|nr:hypothetical protein [Nocardia sp. NRRL S-836]